MPGWQQEKDQLDERLGDPALYSNPDRTLLESLLKRQAQLANDIENAEMRWLEIQEQLESLADWSLRRKPMSPWVISVYFIASTITFILYALDKSAAKNNRWRIEENTLHLCGLIGGWPGALLAQRLFRHKTKKTSFQIIFWITVVFNVGANGWLFLSSAAQDLRYSMGVP